MLCNQQDSQLVMIQEIITEAPKLLKMVLQLVRFSYGYDPRDDNRSIKTSRDTLQSTNFSTSYDPRDNNKSIKILNLRER
jgi:hypothetical protein